MRFEDSGLKNDPLIVDAFNYAQDYNRSLKPEVEAQLREQVESQIEMQRMQIDDAHAAGQIPDEQYEALKKRLDDVAKKNEERIPLVAAQQVEKMFSKASLTPVLELQNYSENTSPSLVAAALLIRTVRDPIDFQKVEGKFGAAVAGLVAEVIHIDSYPGSQDANIAAASTDAKRVILAEMNASLLGVASQLANVPPGMQVMIPPGQDQKLFSQAKKLWGNDKKLDARLVEAFNSAATALKSDFRLEVNAEGKPELTAGARNVKPATPKKGPKGPTITGDDGF